MNGVMKLWFSNVLRIDPGPSGANARCQHKRREGNAFRAAYEVQLRTYIGDVMCVLRP